MQSVEREQTQALQGDRVALKDAKFVYRACSTAYALSLGHASPDDIIGRTDLDLLPEAVAREQMDLDAQTLHSAQADISTIRLRTHPGQVEATAAMIVRTPVLSDSNEVRGIDIRLVGGPSLRTPRSAITVDYELLVNEGLQGSMIIGDDEVLFANDSAARTLGFDNVAQLQAGARLNDLFTVEQRQSLQQAAISKVADADCSTRARVTARRRDGQGVRLLTRVALVHWGSEKATLLSFIDMGPAASSVVETSSSVISTANHASHVNQASQASQMRAQLNALQRSVAVNEPALTDTTPTPGRVLPKALTDVSRMRDHAERFRDFVQASADCYWELDEKLVFRFVSKGIDSVLGISLEQLKGRSFQQWLDSPGNVNDDAHWKEHLKHLADHQPFRDMKFSWLVDGETRVFRYSGTPVMDSADNFCGYRATLCDVTTTVRQTEAMEYHANHDGLTGLVNRRSFEAKVEEALEAARNSRDAHALLFMDLDGFKPVNDTCGHEAGDELLRQLAHLFDSLVRKSDVLGRLGGDEFGVFLYNCKVAEAIKLANQIRHEVKHLEFPWGEHKFSVGVSIGLVVVDDRWENLEATFRAADAACYIAKDEGRNRVVVYREGAGNTSNRQVATQWVEEINSALEEDRFRLAAQKIVPLDDQPDGLRFEVLSRLELTNGSIVSPSSFYPAAERYGLSAAIDKRTIELSLRWLSQQEDTRRQLRHVSINLSGGSFTNPEFSQWMIQTVHDSVLRPEQICFELGETSTIANLAAATKFMQELTDIGCRFSIDDFGSGLSSFGYLRKLPIDFLKIDGFLVRDILDDPTDLTMVKAICDITRSMGKRTVASHIESPRLMNAVRDAGADFVQGMHIGAPELVSIPDA